RPESLEREHVRRREVGHMDVVAKTGTVRRVVVRAVDRKGRAAEGRVDRPRNDVDLGVVILAEVAVRIGARSVEVAQRRPFQSVGYLEVRQRTLDGELRLAVR